MLNQLTSLCSPHTLIKVLWLLFNVSVLYVYWLVPLKHIEVDLQVQGHVATVTSTLQYKNEEEHALEAIFVFPMPSGAALCQFSAKIADQEIVAEVQEKQEVSETISTLNF